MGSLEGRLTGLEGRIAALDARISALDHKFDTRFDLLLRKVVDLDNRLNRIEMQRN